MQSTEEGRKTAYDALIGVCSSLRDSSSVKSNESYKKFIDMVSNEKSVQLFCSCICMFTGIKIWVSFIET